MNDESFKEFQEKALSFNKRARGLFSSLHRIADFSLPKPQEEEFQKIHSRLTQEPPPPHMARLSPKESGATDWLTKFRKVVLSDVQGGLTSAHYHLQQILEIEGAVIAAVLANASYIQMTKGMTVGGTGTRKLDAEYQAFVFSLRRALEYFAVSLGAFFKTDINRIRRLTKLLTDKEPKEISQKLIEFLIPVLQELQDIVPPKDEKMSVRDRLSHWESIPAGVLNITGKENGNLDVFFAGGGENLGNPSLSTGADTGGSVSPSLYGVLFAQMKKVENLIFNSYDLILENAG